MTLYADRLNSLADELEAARKSWLDVYHVPTKRDEAKEYLMQLLWDDKNTLILALKEAAAADASKQSNGSGE